MTEIGMDLVLEHFAAAVDIFLVSKTETEGLRFGVNNDGYWALAPPATLSLDELQEADIPAGLGWAAASISQLRQVCLVRMPAQGEG
jgi:hypothetical protein